MKRLFALALACLIASPAWAGSSTVEYTSAGSSPFRTTTDGSSYNLSNVTIWDSAAGANGWKIDSSNGGLVAGEGVAGTPAGGVFSIQGVSGGTAVPVSGTFYQATQPVSIASAQIASGAVASGAFASGAVASGAFASGSLAAGSMVDLLTMRAPIGGTSSSPADVLVGGCQYNASAPTFTTGDSGAAQCTINGYVIVQVANTATQVTPGNGISAPTGTAPSTSSPVTAFNEMYNGSTWDAMQDDANKMLKTAPTCTGNSIPINQTSSTDVHTFTGYGYICSIVLISGTQQSISISEGTGSTCATGTAYILGGSGGTMAFAQYGGISSVSGVPWLKLKNSADHLCVLQSSTGNVSGTITFADLTN